jgi:integrase/recombinase XerD
MKPREFLEKLEIELKISKASEHTIKNYTRANKSLLDFTGKIPENISENDVKKFMAENLLDKASSSVIVFLSAIRYAFSSLLKKDPTLGIKRPKKERRIPAVLTKEEAKKRKTKNQNLCFHLFMRAGFVFQNLLI